MTSNLNVARKWLNSRRVGSARSNNGNLSYSDGVLYSYATPIANLVGTPRGHSVVLLTTETYSQTTEGKHKNAARRATGYGVEVATFNVPFLLLAGRAHGRSHANRLAYSYTGEEQHKANLVDYDQRIAEEVARISRARVYKSTDRLERLQREREDYRQAFKL